MKAIEDRHDMCWLTSVVSDERPRLIGERTDKGDAPDFRLERKHAVVLEQHHGLIGQLASVGAVLWAVEFLLIDLCVGNRVRRIEHAELDARRKEANQSGIESAFR